ncbi:major paralogous domain-containing protein [Algoriphagus locisalis]|uniref:Major paralogous domain-containing protein n=1 Tax=Algoriphagus locisalis TaxID=305507 RepID=A0A1I7DUR9_9BACT|nr:FISUMP domain-containing protein [Algoriphagus locisalis]SFU15356.1 major paralogous domain-containing protein [Algoriphagus locisalis]
MKKAIYFLIFSLVGLLGCPMEENEPQPDLEIPLPEYSFMVDERDGNQYKIITIADQTWFAENLRYNLNLFNGEDLDAWYQSWAQERGTFSQLNLQKDSVAVYGYIYNWFAISDPQPLCPDGWKIPSNADWDKLLVALGGKEIAGGNMKATTKWNLPNKGATNSSGFSAYPVEWRDAVGNFSQSVGRYTYYWSSSEINSNSAWLYILSASGEGFGAVDNAKNTGVSCRCLKN